jgi:hypothetical protein
VGANGRANGSPRGGPSGNPGRSKPDCLAAVEFGIEFRKGEQLQAAEAGKKKLPNGFDSRLFAAFKQQFSAEAAVLAAFFTNEAAVVRSFAQRIRNHAGTQSAAVPAAATAAAATSIVE